MKACASCPFTTDDETLTACPQCKQVLTPAPSPEEIARATAKIRAGWSRRKRLGNLRTLSCPWRSHVRKSGDSVLLLGNPQ
jgi:hypothetical protein